MDRDPGAGSSPKRRRASRAGLAKRFSCGHPGCGKVYSRAEHLHRHELNHNPKDIFRCDFPNCGLTFVRADLYVRHKIRHSDSTTVNTDVICNEANSVAEHGFQAHEDITAKAIDVDQDISYRVQAGSGHAIASTRWTPPEQRPLPDHSAGGSGSQAQPSVASLDLSSSTIEGWTNQDGSLDQANNNFAAWLFESPEPQDATLSLTGFPLFDFGLQCSSRDSWNYLSPGNVAEFDKHTVCSSGTGNISESLPATKLLSESRRAEVISLLARFRMKQHNQTSLQSEDPSRISYSPDGQRFPNLTLQTLDNLIANFFLSASSQLSIVHEPTFSPSTCHVLLLLPIIALGATDLIRTKPRGHMEDYKELAHIIMSQLRWEVFTENDAEPPIRLWVAQSLLLLEYYEKQCSTRKLHERAHIHHGTTLTLLRRGNPLVGHQGCECPPHESDSKSERFHHCCGTEKTTDTSLETWWLQWVRNESFTRVVYTAFQMDTLHAVMYGHAADMAPYEIRLPLPCDDSLWNASSAVEVQNLDANLKMYGLRPINFLDGLKTCLHGRDVHTHAAARILLMSGLLSIGWHISRREKHLQFLETIPSTREQSRWRLLLLGAFNHWNSSFEDAVGSRNGSTATKLLDFDSARAATLFHLAHMTLHVDIIDCQIFAGTKQLLGRTVSKMDFANVVQRIKIWACTPVAKHATLHAYKLLHTTLFTRRFGPSRTHQTNPQIPSTVYNCRTDPITFRPWAVFIAGLIIWAYQHASNQYLTTSETPQAPLAFQEEQSICCQYLVICAAVDDPAQLNPVLSTRGCAATLGVLSQAFSEADPELLREASKRLTECRDVLQGITVK